MGNREALPTIWEIPDDLWERIEPVILQLDPPKPRGRKRVNQRKMLEGIIFRMRSSCQWNPLPKELGDDSTIPRTFQRWVQLGVLERIWAELVAEYGELGAVEREWQAADCAMGKARFRGFNRTQPHGTGKAGSKRSILVDVGGGPLSVVVAVANVHDTKLLTMTLEQVVMERPEGGGGEKQKVTHPADRGGEAGHRGNEMLSGPAAGG